MEVTIKTKFFEMTIEMSLDNAMNLVRQATEYAEINEPAAVAEQPKAINPAPAQKMKEPPKSRVETMFGARETWNKPAEEKTPEPIKRYNEDGYRGFLYVKCDGCGHEKGFCTKTSITYNRCNCGHVTELRDLLPVYAKCKCGEEFKYRSNIKADKFTINCLKCGAPIDVALNGKQNAFTTL